MVPLNVFYKPERWFLMDKQTDWKSDHLIQDPAQKHTNVLQMYSLTIKYTSTEVTPTEQTQKFAKTDKTFVFVYFFVGHCNQLWSSFLHIKCHRCSYEAHCGAPGSETRVYSITMFESINIYNLGFKIC